VSDPEVIVVGGGTAGCVVAARLVDAGHSVLLVEAGPDYGPFDADRWPEDLLDAASLPFSHDWGYQGKGAGGQSLTFERARVIGGCSTHNGCTQTVGWAGDYDRMAADGCDGWSAAALQPLFEAATRKMQLRHYRDDEVQPFHRVFLESSRTAGVPTIHDLDRLTGELGAGCAPVNTLGNVRVNTAFAYLDAVRDSELLTIVSDAQVDRVVMSGGRATGIEYLVHGRRVHAAASTVVLSAGAYGTPEILLRSGIGPADELRALGIDVSIALEGVGRNLHDHPTVQLDFAATRALADDLAAFAATAWLPEEQTIAKLRSPFADGPFDLHVYPWIEPDPSLATGWRVVIPVSQLRPRSRGTVRLSSADPDARSIVDPRFFSDQDGADLGSVEFGVRWVIDELLAGSIGRYLGEPLGRDIRGLGTDELRAWMRSSHTHYWHPAGTSRMGREGDHAAVVDGEGRVFGSDGLVVADASVFPDIPRATPALPTVVAAERIAAGLVAALS
jgi:choline dehydrogenase